MKPAERVEERPQSEKGIAEHQLTPLQQHFLARLDAVIEKRTVQMRRDPTDKLALRLLARALYAAYMDLVSCGLAEVAAARLEKAQSGIR